MITAGQTVKSPRARYLVQAERGRGGFGIAWRAIRQSDGLPVVLKELRLDRLDSWKAMQLFEREAKVMEELNHPGIPSYIEFFGRDSNGDAFDIVGAEPRESFTTVLVQEFIVGANLEERRRDRKRYGRLEIEQLLRSMLEVLDYLHNLSPPVIHRDISPKNIIRSEAGAFYLVDFGAIQDRLRSGTMLGSTNVGTFGFIPPEQAMGHTKPASDLYALAMTVVVAATGRRPEELRLDEETGKVSLSNVKAPWSSRVAAALDAMLEPIVGKRISSAKRALEMLEEPHALAVVDRGEFVAQLAEGRTIQIGRAENVDIRLLDPSVSRYHASIAHRSSGDFVVRDLGSARGTSLNGRQVTETSFKSGDVLQLGGARFKLSVSEDLVRLTALSAGSEMVKAQPTAMLPGGPRTRVMLVLVAPFFLVLFLVFILMILV